MTSNSAKGPLIERPLIAERASVLKLSKKTRSHDDDPLSIISKLRREPRTGSAILRGAHGRALSPTIRGDKARSVRSWSIRPGGLNQLFGIRSRTGRHGWWGLFLSVGFIQPVTIQPPHTTAHTMLISGWFLTTAFCISMCIRWWSFTWWSLELIFETFYRTFLELRYVTISFRFASFCFAHSIQTALSESVVRQASDNFTSDDLQYNDNIQTV